VATDGAARGNPGPAGIGVAILDESGETVAEVARGIGVATNNVAEYTAAIEGLKAAADRGARTVLLRSDSRLLIEQLAGRFRVKAPTLQRLHEEARRLMERFDRVDLAHVRRELNAHADELANRGVDEWLAAEGSDYEPTEPPPPLFDPDE
jgi:ribonuclease HI